MTSASIYVGMRGRVVLMQGWDPTNWIFLALLLIGVELKA